MTENEVEKIIRVATEVIYEKISDDLEESKQIAREIVDRLVTENLRIAIQQNK